MGDLTGAITAMIIAALIIIILAALFGEGWGV